MLLQMEYNTLGRYDIRIIPSLFWVAELELASGYRLIPVVMKGCLSVYVSL
jgi:hypothetical protein